MSRAKPEFVSIEKGNSRERQLLLSCIPLKRLSVETSVVGYASGCMIDYCGFRLILSVSHATLKAGSWALDLKYDDETGMELFRIPSLNFLGRMSTADLTGFLERGSFDELSKEMVDFSYGVLPGDLESIHEQFGQDGRRHWRAARTVFKPTFQEAPVHGMKYGFSGHTRIEKLPHPTSPHMSVLCSTQTLCDDLSYVRTEGDEHCFQLPGEHPGDVHFHGCSGAPILNEHGEVVALVTGRTISDDTIRGISLRTYKTAIDIEVGNIRGFKQGD